MSASEIMAFAVILALLGRWAHGVKNAVTAKIVVEVIFAVVVISFMDQGKTEPIAKGFAWLFLAGVLLSPTSILSGLAKAGVTTPKTVAPFAPGYHPPAHAQNVRVL
jgi:hypothetical protein